MDTLVLSQIEHGSTAYLATVNLRNAVLREPLGLKLAAEDLDCERSDFHLVCYENSIIVGCLVLTPISGDTVKMRQVAVLPERQRRGVGRALVAFSEAFTREHGFAIMTLHARDTAVPFYEKLGYDRVGEPFEEVTITHWEMRKQL